MYGCYHHHNKVGIDGTNNERLDAEYGSQGLAESSISSNAVKHMGEIAEQPYHRKTADFSGYVFQIIFQVFHNVINSYFCFTSNEICALFLLLKFVLFSC